MRRLTIIVFILCGCLAPVPAQEEKSDPARNNSVPIYQVTVERRSIRALNYGHRGEPTKIDFHGTVLLPKAQGEARIANKGGVVEIDCKFEKMESPERFGPQYLTYVLWALTPDGRPSNLGEILTNSSNKSKFRTTTSLQTFALIVTAEPYFSVTQPSNVVVLENVPRRDTAGKVEEVAARYELLPRSEGALNAPAVEFRPPASNRAERVSMGEYESLLALYQALNAVQIARSQGADRYAADTMQEADQLYREALKLHNNKPGDRRVATMAREAAQKAEDARTIAQKHNARPQPVTQSSR